MIMSSSPISPVPAPAVGRLTIPMIPKMQFRSLRWFPGEGFTQKVFGFLVGATRQSQSADAGKECYQ